ncbi:Lsr2 protein [Williamsia muralis]|uniref:Lsr2 protein n=1 Tax=Williamsia marianensis TaxID=85044 RepID=A0A495KAD3_WILMA|nr:histone-like nucleoid-structuring protein Lsr2 [Williamsia muralis]RKR97449.1 Lsr2 protein [Williamsia muralis]
MAEKTVFQYFDDLDGAALDVEDLQTVEWSWRGAAYHFDTSTAHFEDIEAGRVSVAELLTKSFRTNRRPRVLLDARVGPSMSAGPTRAPGRRTRIGEMRLWALENKHAGVGKRGRLSKTVIAAYNRAH